MRDCPPSSPRSGRAAPLFALLLALSGCKEDPPRTSEAGQPDKVATAAPSAPSPGASAGPGEAEDAGAEAGPGPECPEVDTASWTPFEAGVDGCAFLAPPSKEALASEKLAWEPCPEGTSMPKGCRQVALPAAASIDPTTARAEASKEGEARLLFERACHASRAILLAKADGEAEAALFDEGKRSGCDLRPASLGPGRYALVAASGKRAGKEGESVQAVLDGEADARVPAVVRKLERAEAGLDAQVSSRLRATYAPGMKAGEGTLSVTVFGGEPKIVSSTALAGSVVLVGDAAFWGERGGTLRGFTADASVTAVDRDGRGAFTWAKGTAERGGHGLGTDGERMVWTRREGEGAARTCHAMTAPFELVTEKVQTKKLRTIPCFEGLDEPWTVGCGYAAHAMGKREILLLRLEDGTSWILRSSTCRPGATTDKDAGFCPLAPLAIGCSELFVSVSGEKPTLARLPLAALGQGAPAPN